MDFFFTGCNGGYLVEGEALIISVCVGYLCFTWAQETTTGASGSNVEAFLPSPRGGKRRSCLGLIMQDETEYLLVYVLTVLSIIKC